MQDVTVSRTQDAFQRSNHVRSLGWLGLAISVCTAMCILIVTSVNIPFEDDYDGIGEFLERYVGLHGFGARAGWVLTAQHVQYKLILLQAIVALEYQLTGLVNFRFLQLLGDLAIPPVLAALWFLLRRTGWTPTQRIWLFVGPSFLILSLCYFEAANWALSGLQNLAVVAFALGSFVLMTSTLRFAISGSLAFLLLAILASGNGFIAAVVVLVYLMSQHRFRATAIVAALTLGLAMLYAVRYQAPQNSYPIPLRTALLALVEYPFVFLGSIAGRPVLAAPLGLAAVVGFVQLGRRRWFQLAPGTFCAALFCLLTACGVAATRYSLGYDSAVAGRYRIYSCLLLALELMGWYETAKKPAPAWPVKKGQILLVTGTLGLFWLASSVNAYRHLQQRRTIVTNHLILWERNPQKLVLVPDEDPIRQTAYWVYLRTRGQADIDRLVKQDLYRPPVSGNSPILQQTDLTRPHRSTGRDERIRVGPGRGAARKKTAQASTSWSPTRPPWDFW